MKPREYKAMRKALGWTHEQIANTLGVEVSTAYRYQRGAVEVPEPAARLLRLLVLLRLTASARKFEEIIAEVRHD